MRSVGEVLVYLMTMLMAIPVAAQQPVQEHGPVLTPAATAVERPNTMPVRALRIIALEGDGAVNYIPSRTVTVPVVEVHNQNDLPVEGATVIFQAPAVGPGGFFGDNQTTLKTTTNSRGQASAQGFHINTEPGRFALRATAYYRDLSATYVIKQENSTRTLQSATERKSHKWIWIGVAAGAAAAAGTAFALRGGSSSSPHISASTGPIVITAP
ncbi:MAG: hypothetical protein ACM336_03225 [Acidobacteriota bacterium]